MEQDTFWPTFKASLRGLVQEYALTLWLLLGIGVIFYFFIKPRMGKYLLSTYSQTQDADPQKTSDYHDKRRLAIEKLQEKYQEKAKEMGLKKVEPKAESEDDDDTEEVCMISSKPAATVPTSTKPTSSSKTETFKRLRPAYNPLDGSGATSRFKPSCNSKKKGG